MRLRQLALVAEHLEPVLDDLCGVLGVGIAYRDPGIANFGLQNALLALGDTFLEVVSPIQPGTTAGRLLDRRGGDGGYMAGAVEEVLGFVQGRGGEPGMTGTLTIRYRKPTPLYRPLRLVGEIVRVESRKIFTEGRLLGADDTLYAEGESLFITPHPEQYERLVAARSQRETEQSP